ncbi:MAG: hypothetical protein U5J98_09410 [Halobacteriales archaeon]|nr:hypothetical protein [Halobacteriales archaeon]
MKDELQLTMLGHYPKFSSAYYFAAIQKEDPDLWLDVEAVQRNSSDWYNEDYHRFVVQSKLEDLAGGSMVLNTEDEDFSAGMTPSTTASDARVPA